MTNKFKQLADKIYQLQAQHVNLPPEVYVELQEVMHELRSVEPLDIKDIGELVKFIDNSRKTPGEMIVELLRQVEKKHGIE